MDTLELANFAENLLGSQNKIIDLPYHPFYIKLFYLEKGLIHLMEEFQAQSYLTEPYYHYQYLGSLITYLLMT